MTTSETGERSAAHRSGDLWPALAAILSEPQRDMRLVLSLLGRLWTAATNGCSVCVVSCLQSDSEAEFLVADTDDPPSAAGVGRFPLKVAGKWTETVPRVLSEDFGEYEVVRFRGPDHVSVGGVLVSTTDAVGDDPLMQVVRSVSARAIVDCRSSPSARDRDAPAGTPEPDIERLESLAEFAAGAGHEINNPLGTIIGRVQLLLRDETDVARRQSLATIGGQAYRIRDMIGDAMLFARPPSPAPEWNLLSSVVDEVLTGMEDDLSAAGFDIDVEFARDARLFADPVQLRVTLEAVVRNAVEARSDSRSPRMRIELTDATAGTPELLISDNGVGLTEEQRRHLFDPFYSGRQAGRGLGFGLSKCWRIVSNHGGSIRVETESGWTVFRVLFPDPSD